MTRSWSRALARVSVRRTALVARRRDVPVARRVDVPVARREEVPFGAPGSTQVAGRAHAEFARQGERGGVRRERLLRARAGRFFPLLRGGASSSFGV